MIDTLRLLISWRCNLSCPYCCNEIPRFREQFKPVTLASLDFGKYTNVCVSGGEPLLDFPRLLDILKQIPAGRKIILYTNGTLLTREKAKALEQAGVGYINVGLHEPESFNFLIWKGLDAVKDTSIKIRFHVQDIYEEELTKKYLMPDKGYVNHRDLKGDRTYVLKAGTPVFRFWKMDDCDRGNEDRVVLENP